MILIFAGGASISAPGIAACARSICSSAASSMLALTPSTELELAALEELLDLPDNDLLAWIMDEGQSAPERYAPVLLRIVAFHHAGPDDLNKDR